MSENKKTKIAEAVESSVDTMINALESTQSLNDKVREGCRYLQNSIHSKLVSLCEKDPNPENHTWKLAYEGIPEMKTLVGIIQNAKIPAFARRYIAVFFEEYAGVPMVRKEIFIKGKARIVLGIDTENPLDISTIKELKSQGDSLWFKGTYPPVFPEIAEEGKVANKAPKERTEKTPLEKLEAFSKRLVSGDKKAIKENSDLNTILTFVVKNYQKALIIAKITSDSEFDAFVEGIKEKSKINPGIPTVPKKEENK